MSTHNMFSCRNNVVATHEKCLAEALLMSTNMFLCRNKKNSLIDMLLMSIHNIHFQAEI